MPHRAPPIKVVLFDVDDVLYDASSWNRWLSQILTRLSPRSLEADFNEAWHDVFLPGVHRGQQEFHVALAGCLKSIGLADSHIEEMVAASRGQRRRAQNSVRPFAAVRGTLTRLQSAGIGRTVLADSERSAQRVCTHLDRLRLAGLFDQVLSSVDLSASLMDDAAYAQALKMVNCSASEMLFISHRTRALVAAQNAGLRTLGFNVRRGACGMKCINRFEEMTSIVLAQLGIERGKTVRRLSCRTSQESHTREGTHACSRL